MTFISYIAGFEEFVKTRLWYNRILCIYCSTGKNLDRHLTTMGGWPQRTRGSRCSRSACPQGRYTTPRGYAPLEST